MKDEQKNFVIFAVIAALLLFAWPMITSRFFPSNPPVTKIEGGKTKVVTTPGADPAADGAAATRDRAVVLRETPRVRIDTPSLEGSINTKGARIDDLVLATYPETIAKNSPPVRLFSPSGAPLAYFANFGWTGTNIDLPKADTVFTPSGDVLAPGKPVTLSWTNATGQRFDITYEVDDKFMFTVRQTVANAGGGPVIVQPYQQLSRTGVPADLDSWTNHIGPVGVFGNGANYDIGYTNLKGNKPGFFAFGSTAKAGENSFNATGGWMGFSDKYWLAALIPDQRTSVNATFPAAQGDHFWANVSVPQAQVPAGRQVTTVTHLFAGGKEVKTLDGYEESLGIQHFGKAIDWGWFEIIEKPIFTYLHFLFTLIGNFGVAIMLLTVTIRLLLFPIAQRQFRSMAQMRAIQPKMKAIQERYKDDKPLMQQKVMELYREEKVNPLAGCAPTLLQIPIMFALYKVLLLSTEMRHQPFVLWIRDLSAPDPLTPVNLFGLLAFTPPHFLAIGVVPILLGISMYFQFKLNPAPMDEAQKQVFAIMPWMLMFVMAPFAVGLQVYWITSNCLTMLQQWFLYRQHPVLKTAPAK